MTLILIIEKQMYEFMLCVLLRKSDRSKLSVHIPMLKSQYFAHFASVITLSLYLWDVKMNVWRELKNC